MFRYFIVVITGSAFFIGVFMSSSSLPPANWYQDPANPNLERFWNGFAWTDNVRDPADIVPNPPPPPPTPSNPHVPSFGSEVTPPTFNGSISGFSSYASDSGVSAPPSNYLVLGILTTIFCCLPFGIVSIVFSSKVNSLWARGDFEGARVASVKARRYGLFALFAGIIGVVAGVLAAVVLSTTCNVASDYSNDFSSPALMVAISAANVIATDANFKAVEDFNGVLSPGVLGAAYFDYYGPDSVFPDRESALLNTASCLNVNVDDISSPSATSAVVSVYIEDGMAYSSELPCS